MSAKPGRSSTSILERGLKTRDFSNRNALGLEFEDGSQAAFGSAFFVRDDEARRVAVFTEHCGYHEFHGGGLEIWNVEIA